MNPNMVKTPTDSGLYRREYLRNLQLQAENDKKNLDANLIYKKTGQTPSQPTDYRTTTEKAADTDGMRRDIRFFLSVSGICDSTNANNTVLTLTPEELRFTTQYKLFIESDFKARGVPAELFVNYLRRIKAKSEKAFGVQQQIQQVNKPEPSNSDIFDSCLSIEEIDKISNDMGVIMEWIGGDRMTYDDRILFGEIAGNLEELKNLIPSAEELSNISFLPPPRVANIQTLLSQLVENLPTKQLANNALESIKKRVDANDLDGTIRQLEALNELIKFDHEKFNIKRSLIDELERTMREIQAENQVVEDEEQLEQGGGSSSSEEEEEEKEPAGGGGRESLKSEIRRKREKSVEGLRSISQPKSPKPRTRERTNSEEEEMKEKIPRARQVSGQPIQAEAKSARSSAGVHEVGSFSALIHDLTEGTSTDRLRELRALHDTGGELRLDGRVISVDDISVYKERPEGKTRQSNLYKKPKFWKERTNVEELYNIIKAREAKEEAKEGQGHGLGGRLRGRGLGRSHSVKKMEGEYVKPKPYKQLGKYLINSHKLNDGIVMIRHVSGNALPHLPTHKVGNNVAHILKQVVGGGLPCADTICGLGLEEKRQLHNIQKHTRIDLPVAISHPDLSESKKTHNRFEILKGELSAGNNSPILLKEFKVLLMRLMDSGDLPRRQAHSIMTDLTAMGY